MEDRDATSGSSSAPESAGPATDVTANAEADAPPATSATPTGAEEKFEDVWRPRRHRHGDRRPPRRERDRDHRRGTRPDRTAEAGSGATTPPAAAGSTHPTAELAAVAPGPQSGGRDHVRARDRDRDRDRKGGRGLQQPSPHRRKGEDRGRGQDRRAPEVMSAAPPRSKGPSEADSPFAKLGALREALERRSKEKSSS